MADNQEAKDPPDGGASVQAKSIMASVTCKRQGTTSLITRLFSRQTAVAKESEAPEPINDNEVEQEKPQVNELKVMPCPFIRPLGMRLQPRQEPSPLSHRGSIAKVSAAITVTRNRGETSRMLNSRLSVASRHSLVENELPPSKEEDGSKPSIDVQLAQQREYVAVTAAPDAYVVDDWRFYIRCYSEVSSMSLAKGLFN
jgi:hypothetical protein